MALARLVVLFASECNYSENSFSGIRTPSSADNAQKKHRNVERERIGRRASTVKTVNHLPPQVISQGKKKTSISRHTRRRLSESKY